MGALTCRAKPLSRKLVSRLQEKFRLPPPVARNRLGRPEVAMSKPMLIEKKWPFQDRGRIQLFSMSTPNGVKVSIALEELGLPYEPHLVDITKGDQNTAEFKSISPNSKIPAIVDPDGPGGEPLALMESGAILIHLAEKTGKLVPSSPAKRLECFQWLFFQVGHVGPMLGQFGHFYKFAREACKDPYPLERYTTETKRLLGVLDRQLEGREFLVDEYSIADIATFPWINGLLEFYQAGDDVEFSRFTHLGAWLERCNGRPASARGKNVNTP
jgi:GSH-dependent disulfide-bond oxidoreductase